MDWKSSFQNFEKCPNFISESQINVCNGFKTVDKQVKSNSSVQLFLEVYYYQRIASYVYTRNIAYENKIIASLKLNEFDQFKKKLVAYLVPWTFKQWKVLQNFWYCLIKINSCKLLISKTNRISLNVLHCRWSQS